MPVVTSGSRIRLFDDLQGVEDRQEELSLVFVREPLLPLRLDQELLPLRSEQSDVILPSSLRF
jgi:hypothetical protein